MIIKTDYSFKTDYKFIHDFNFHYIFYLCNYIDIDYIFVLY